MKLDLPVVLVFLMLNVFLEILFIVKMFWYSFDSIEILTFPSAEYFSLLKVISKTSIKITRSYLFNFKYKYYIYIIEIKSKIFLLFTVMFLSIVPACSVKYKLNITVPPSQFSKSRTGLLTLFLISKLNNSRYFVVKICE